VKSWKEFKRVPDQAILTTNNTLVDSYDWQSSLSRPFTLATEPDSPSGT
jgi:hypothetical protein